MISLLRHSVACLGLILSCAFQLASAQSYNWRTVEIGGTGFVTGTVFHPTEPGLVYARTDVGGAYRLDTATNRWIALNDDVGGTNNEFQHLGVLTIGLDRNDANRVYIATGQYGGVETWKLPSRIYRSTDRGATWTYTTPGFKMAGNGEGRGTGERMAVDPVNGTNILVGTSDAGIWRSTDYGATWARLTNFTPTSLNFLLYAPASAPGPGPNRRVYAAANTLTGQSFWFSDNNGSTWSQVPNHPGMTIGSEMMPLQGSFDAAGVFYSTWGNATGPSNYSSNYGVWKMSADGTTWTSILPPTGQGSFGGISADPRVAGHVVVTTLLRWWPGDEVYRSTDGGTTWTATLLTGTRSVGNSPWSSGPGAHWLTDIDIDPFNSNRAMFNTGFGLFQTTNLATTGTARTWTFFNDGLEEAVPLGLHSPTAGPPLVSVIADYTGFRHDDLNRSPIRGSLSPGSGSTNVINGADLAPAKIIRQNGGTTLYSQDAAATSAPFPTTPAPIINGHNRVILSTDGQRLLWCPPNSPAYLSTDNGATWTISTNSQSLTNSSGTETVAVLAGAAGTFGTTNATGGSARFYTPSAIALDSAGVRYIADTGNHTIRKIDAGGAVSTFAGGAGVSGSTDATGTTARFNFPAGIAVDAAKNVYVADTGNHTIRKITAAGVVTTLAGGVGLTGSTNATGTAARFSSPAGLAVDSSGNVFICDAGNHTIRKISSAGVVTTVAGSPGLSGTTNANGSSARFTTPQGITLDTAGNLYIADSGNHAIRKIASNGDVTTFAGLAGTSGSADATGGSASFNTPKGITLDATGTFHVADSGNHTIRKITSAGVVTTVAGLAGSLGTANGAGTTARFNNPTGLVTTPDGINLYIADTANHTIRTNTIYNTLTPLADRVDALRFYLWDGTAKRMLTSTDGGVSFAQIATGMNSAFALFRTVPGNNGHLWVSAGSSGIYRSTNFGASFTKLSTVAEVYQFDFGKAKPGNTHPAVFIWGKVGTIVGFFRSDDIGVTWTRINDDLHNFGYQNDIAGDPRVYGRVYLATSGRGVVVGEIANPTPPVSQPSQTVYADALSSGWTNVSPTGTSLTSTSPVRRGTNAVSITSGTGRGLALTCTSRSLEGFAALAFWVHAGASVPPPLQVGSSRGGISLEAAPITVPATVGWQRIVVPFTSIGISNITDLTGLRIESRVVNGATPGAFSLDDVVLVGNDDFSGPTTASVTLSNLAQIYNGAPKPATITTNPSGLGLIVTYNGSATVPTVAGSYAVSAVVDDAFFTGSASGTLVISKAAATVTLTGLAQTYDGFPKPVSYTTVPASLPATLTYNGSSTAPTQPGSYAVAATINHANYQGTAGGTLVIAKAPQTITFGSLPSRTFGDAPFTIAATSGSGLPVTFSLISGPATLAGNTLTLTGAGTVVVRASQSGSATYLPAPDIDQSFNVAKAPATITLAGLAQTYDGSPKPVSYTTVPASLPVTVTYNGSSTAPTQPGSYPFAATINHANYQGTASGTLVIAKAAQTITFGSLPSRTFGDAPFTIAATSGSGLPVTFSLISGPATLAGNTLTLTGAGTVVVRASQSGSATYLPAPDIDQSFNVAKAPATVTLAGLAQTYDGSPKSASYTTVPASLPATVTYNGGSTAPTQPGSYAVAATINHANYQGNASDTLVIAKVPQTITFGTLPDRTFDDAPFGLTATADSGLAVSYQILSGPATLAGNTLTLNGSGIVSIRASQSGNISYLPAPNVDQSFTVNKAPATITLGNLTPTYDGTPKAVSYTTVPASLLADLTYNGSTTAPSLAGSYAVTASINDSNFQGSASGTLVIARAAQTITFGALPVRTFGEAPFGLNASADSSLPISYQIVSGPATVSGNLLNITGAGDVTVLASQPGNATYLPALPIEQTFAVNKGPATIALANLSHIYDGSPKSATFTTAPTNTTVDLLYNGAQTAPYQIGSYEVTAVIVDDNYEGSASGTLVIAAIPQALTFTPLPDKTFGDAAFALTATADSGLPVSFSLVSGPATLVGDTLTLAGAGTVTVRASQAGDATRAPAPDVDRSFTITKATATITLGDLTATYDGTPKTATSVTNPANLTVTKNYGGNSAGPVEAGTYPVAATIVDDNYQGTASDTLTILAAHTLLENWRFEHFSTYANTGNAANSEDPDHDGIENLMEFALGLDPELPSTLPAALVMNGGQMEYTYTRSKAALGELTFTVERSDSLPLSDWTAADVTEITPPLADNGITQTVKVTLPAGNSRRFIRLRVTALP